MPIHFKKGKIQCISCVIKFVKFDWLTALCYSQSCKNLLTRNFILFQWMCMVNFQLDYGLVKLQTLLTSVTACCVNKFWFLKNALQCAQIRFCEALFDANYFYLTLSIKHTIIFPKVVRRYTRKEENYRLGIKFTFFSVKSSNFLLCHSICNLEYFIKLWKEMKGHGHRKRNIIFWWNIFVFPTIATTSFIQSLPHKTIG